MYIREIEAISCPQCGGQVEYWEIGADCRGNDSACGRQCLGCKAVFDSKRWGEIVKKHSSRTTTTKAVKPLYSKESVLKIKQSYEDLIIHAMTVIYDYWYDGDGTGNWGKPTNSDFRGFREDKLGNLMMYFSGHDYDVGHEYAWDLSFPAAILWDEDPATFVSRWNAGEKDREARISRIVEMENLKRREEERKRQEKADKAKLAELRARYPDHAL